MPFVSYWYYISEYDLLKCILNLGKGSFTTTYMHTYKDKQLKTQPFYSTLRTAFRQSHYNYNLPLNRIVDIPYVNDYFIINIHSNVLITFALMRGFIALTSETSFYTSHPLQVMIHGHFNVLQHPRNCATWTHTPLYNIWNIPQVTCSTGKLHHAHFRKITGRRKALCDVVVLTVRFISEVQPCYVRLHL